MIDRNKVVMFKNNLCNRPSDSYELSSEEIEILFALVEHCVNCGKIGDELEVCIERYEDKKSAAQSILMQNKNCARIVEAYYQGVFDAYKAVIDDLSQRIKA